ncbi:MAG: N-6 DNA methylase [Thermomicrobiales bacterium]
MSRLIVEILEPFHGKIRPPPAARRHVRPERPLRRAPQRRSEREISIYGQERIRETSRLCRMNLAVHGSPGQIREGNTYYEDLHRTAGQFDFVMANPPFNVNAIDKERLEGDPRFSARPADGRQRQLHLISLFYSAPTSAATLSWPTRPVTRGLRAGAAAGS